MIELVNLSIGYPSTIRKSDTNRMIASNINALLDSSQLICLVGVNGVGKSTLLKTIAGFITPLSGDILLSNNMNTKKVSILNLKEDEKARQIGVVLTNREDVGLLSVFEVVSMGRIPYSGLWGSISSEDEMIICDSIKSVGIEHLKSCCFNELSDGERQKVMIAKALAQQTPLIILDEPSAFLDYPSKEELMKLLVKLAHEEHKSILLSSHDLDIIRRFADGYWIMEKKSGKVFLRTSPEY